ncbi:MAG TPA: hypothetical protein VKW78_22395 [Terriglobales bacterium]|nr:hypothetical protein [Terriglobales bacterium]
MRRYTVVSILVLILSAFSFAKIAEIGPIAPGSVPDAVSKTLEAKGYRVALPDGTVICDIWLRANIPAQTGRDVEGANYPELSPSEFIGTVTFPRQVTDFRGQPITPGTYNLRYELLPNDGNHMGVAPNRDFLLLLPVASGANPAAQLSFDEMVAQSAKASGTPHPAAFSLVQPEGDTFPAIYKNDDGYYVFAVKLKTSSGELPIGLVVKGQAQ